MGKDTAGPFDSGKRNAEQAGEGLRERASAGPGNIFCMRMARRSTAVRQVSPPPSSAESGIARFAHPSLFGGDTVATIPADFRRGLCRASSVSGRSDGLAKQCCGREETTKGGRAESRHHPAWRCVEQAVDQYGNPFVCGLLMAVNDRRIAGPV